MWWRTLSSTPFHGTGSLIVRRRAAGLRSSHLTRITAAAAVRAVATSSLTACTVASHAGVRSVRVRNVGTHHRRDGHYHVCPSALFQPRRAQSSLQKLLDDPSDPYLGAMQDFDIPRIADIVEAGPATTAVPAAFLQRLGMRTDNDVAAATRAQYAGPTPLTSRPAQSSAEAVLQSLHATGVARQHEAEAAAAAERQSAQAAYDALSESEKAALQTERVVSHLFDGLCAVSAAIRMQAEDGAATPEELEAVRRVCAAVVAAQETGSITAERWAADFAAEMAELEVIWRHLGDPRPLPSKK